MHNKILTLAKNKLNSIEMEFWKWKIKMKDNLRSENEEYISNDTSCKATLWEWAVWNERLKK